MQKMNKRAEQEIGEKSLFLPLIIFVIVIVIIAFFWMLANYAGNLAEVPPELKAELISLRFTNTPECFAYENVKVGRVYPGIIDLDKFNKAQLDRCYLTEDKTGYQTYNFRLLLKDQDLNLLTNNFFNKVSFTIYRDVIVRQGDHLFKDQLIIYVQEKI